MKPGAVMQEHRSWGLELGAVGELQPDDTADDDRQPERLGQCQRLVEQNAAESCRTNRADARPYGVADPHVDGFQGRAEEIQR